MQPRGAAIRTKHVRSSRGSTREVVQSYSNRLVLNNYLSGGGVGRQLLDENVELLDEDLPQLRDDQGYKQRNVILAFSACGYKYPVHGCRHTVAPQAGMRNEHLEQDEGDHLLGLCVEPQLRENLMFTHWEAEHCPSRTVARVKAACPYFDCDGNACPVTLTAVLWDLKRHLKSVHGVADADMTSYNLQSCCSKVNKSAPTWGNFVPVSAGELTVSSYVAWQSGTALWPVTCCLDLTHLLLRPRVEGSAGRC